MSEKLTKTKILNLEVEVQYVDINILKEAEYNPRVMDSAAENHLKKSLLTHGFVHPATVNSAPKRKNIIIAGNQRVRVARKLGYTKVPVIYLNIPNLNTEKALNLRSNAITGWWDDEKLKDFDFKLLLDAGFSDLELGRVWDNALETEDDGFDLEKAVAEVKVPVTRPGDIFQLGDHKLICGDATDPAVVAKIAKPKSVHMVYCDPPYNIGLSYANGLTTNDKYQGRQTNDHLSDGRYGVFLGQSMENALAVSKDDAHVFYWCDETYIGMVQALFAHYDLKNRRVCLWLKNNFNMTPQVAFNKAVEPCVYATRGKPYLAPTLTNLNEVMNKEVTNGNRLSDDVLDLLNIWLVKRVAGQDYEHPTEKPPTLHEKALRRCTRPGDTVLDLFGGSGSTLIACEQMKRKCLVVEIEPVFCDVIIKRFESLTQIHAKQLN